MIKLENNWRQKSLESLEKNTWTAPSSDEGSYLIKTCNSLRKKQLQDFTTEDLRIMIGQEIGLYFLIPLAIETLTDNLFAEGDMYEGDLLKNVLDVDTKFWDDNKNYWQQLNDLIKDRRQEIKEMKFDISKFDNCKHRQ
ncbi:MAG: contact-dependent growth inhibition system immunity protein [Ignavibacteriaceae bacterium]